MVTDRKKIKALAAIGLLTAALAGGMATVAEAQELPPGALCVPDDYLKCAKNYICKQDPFNSSIYTCQCAWGRIEVPFLSGSSDICQFVAGSGNYSLRVYLGDIIYGIIALTIMAAIVSILIGGYFYMTAGGNADWVRMAKVWIGSAILGIILALMAWTILSLIASNLV